MTAAKNKILIIGQAPGRLATKEKPFSIYGPSGRLLREIAGADTFDERFDTRNVLPRWYGKSGKGDAFPIRIARIRASHMHIRHHVVLLAGKHVARAFGIHTEYFWPVFRNGRTFYVVPHPSRINRWWNSERNVDTARCFFRHIWGGR